MGGGYLPSSTAETLAVLAAFISSVNIAGKCTEHAISYLPGVSSTYIGLKKEALFKIKHVGFIYIRPVLANSQMEFN